MIRNLWFIASAVATLTLLSGCGGAGSNARDILGLGKKSPDEFRVVSRPPLTIPKDFTLRPPEAGASGLGLPAADKMARATMVGESLPTDGTYDYTRTMGPAETAVGVVSSYDLKSTADESFLSNVGATHADPTIRQQLYQDRTKKTAGKEDSALFQWLNPTDDDEVLVDAEAEKKRLQTNAEQGKDVMEGETPVLGSAQEGLLNGLFN